MHIPSLVKSTDVNSSYHPETKYGRTTDRQANGHTDVQCEIIIPHHYRVAGYKNQRMSYTKVIIKDLSQKKKNIWRKTDLVLLIY